MGIGPKSGFLTAIRRSKSTADGIKPVWRIWPGLAPGHNAASVSIEVSATKFGRVTDPSQPDHACR